MSDLIDASSNATMFVLLEGASDVAAVRALMTTHELDGTHVDLVNMQGSTNVGRVLKEIRQIRGDADVVGLCDAGQTRAAEKALADDGLPVLDASDLPIYGFFVCEPDLEGELVRALGAQRAKAAIEGAGLAGKFEALRAQADWTDEPMSDQVHRFATAASGRRENIAAVLAGALGEDDLPEPISMLLDRIRYA